MESLRIIVVEDEEILRVSLTDDLIDAGYVVKSFENPIDALAEIKKANVDLVITDVKMPGMSGIELLNNIKKIKEETIVIVMTAFASVNAAVDAMKKGAYDYIHKPFQIDELLLQIDRIKDLINIKQENVMLRTQVASKYSLDSFVGESQSSEHLLELVSIISKKDTTVLITGETGTGKEHLTHILHHQSNRYNKPFIKVSCAILSREIFESELFGHEKGAFTGAMKERKGRFEMADSGTLYLDDVDDIPLDLQVKLLRVLQEQEFERVGGNKTINVDVRVIASTKADIRELVNQGKFREDLFYRLNVFPIHIEPLRDRPEDIPGLIDHFVKLFAEEKDIKVNEDAMNYLKQYNWPGNIREIKNISERLVLMTSGNQIKASSIPLEIVKPSGPLPELSIGKKPLDDVLADVEINIILQALNQSHGNKAKAAEILGIPASTLRSKINKYDLNDD